MRPTLPTGKPACSFAHVAPLLDAKTPSPHFAAKNFVCAPWPATTTESTHRETAALPHPTAFWHLWESPLLAVGGGSYLDELITIAREGHLPAEIYHLKAAGQANWPKLDAVIAAEGSVKLRYTLP